METKTTSLILLAAVVLGGVWYLSSRPMGDTAGITATTTAATTTNTVPQQTTPKPSSVASPASQPTKTTAQTVGVGSLNHLLGLKQSLTCSFKTVGGTVRSGTLYVAEGKAHANLTSSSMVHDGSYLYAWMTGASTGTKLQAASSVSGSVIVGKGGIDPNGDLSFACNPWAADSSLFTPPSSVSF